MSHWQKIRNHAALLRREICRASGLDENGLFPAVGFVRAGAEHLGLDLIPEHPDSANLSRALAVLEDDCVYYNNHLKDWYQAFCIAHELGHHHLHRRRSGVHCTREEIRDFADGDGEADTAAEKIVGYGAGERREREANLFALELLLPCEALRAAYLRNSLDLRQIARLAEMPPDVVAGQLSRALLVPVSETGKAADAGAGRAEKDALNESQKRAAESGEGPLLVCAGPGTGKTQTLTARIAYLIERGVEPKRILALTFSNKAAEEVRERIGRTDETAAAQIQVMTFHAYGLDLLRSYWVEAGLEPHSRLLEKIDALLFLEKNLGRLGLDHYQHLPEPTQNLGAILGAVSRAKDELCSPEAYRELGEKMLLAAQGAADEELKMKAERVLETARVYELYQSHLEAEKLLDFGDLVYRAVRLLRENAVVRGEVRARYDAILVDEFQDVNRACGVLLKEIAGAGAGLWAVGDLRQSIYRWRGASPSNIELFGVDFPNAKTVSLGTNYRSRPEIVGLFASFARKMKTAAPPASAGDVIFNDWQAHRGAAGDENSVAVKVEVADSLDAEAASVAAQIRRYRGQGLKYKDCAVICRTHAQLHKFARVLSERGVPVFYLGELFQREEVRDLLALLDSKVTPGGHSLIRVARFPEYRIPPADALEIVAAQKENNRTCPEVLADPAVFSRLSEEGKPGAEKLLRHLQSSAPGASAWDFLADYLFAASDYLKTCFDSDDARNQAKRLAIYQFLRLAQTAGRRFSGGENSPVAELLGYVKKLAHFNEDKNHAQIPAEAENLDAVRLLTVHSAKGLEFRAVFLPYLGAGKFPAVAKTQTCPDPDGMIAGEVDFHESEEECLFFVAMSRARDHLHLSRSTKYGKSNSGESKFLQLLAGALPPAEKINSEETKIPGEKIRESGGPQRQHQVFYSADLDRYLRCRRDYFYTNVLGLKAPGDKSVYLKFHGCVYDTLRSMQSTRRLETPGLTEEAALARLEEFWQAAGIEAHPYAPVYKERAEEIVRRAFRKLRTVPAPDEITRPTYEVKLAGGAVRVRPDAVEIREAGGEKIAVVRKYKTGKSPKKPSTEDADVLMLVAAQSEFPDARAVLQKIYLSDDARQEVPVSPKVVANRLKLYEEAIEGINRRAFDPAPNDNNCPDCPHFFVCPSGD